MKTRLSIFMVLLAFAGISQNQQTINKMLCSLPDKLELKNNEIQTYHMQTVYEDFDMYGNFRNKTLVNADYTCGLENGNVKWNNVFISKWDGKNNKYHDAQKQDIMEGFTYVPSEEMLNPQSFPNFPPNSTQLQNLVWDMIGFEVFAWEYFDSLELNKEFVASTANGEVDLAGSGTFENKDIRLVWRGISKINNELCAIIEFTAMNNPLKIKNDFINIKGRSHYWGNVYVSLEDKQIEYAIMDEDVIMEIKFSGQDNANNMNTTRRIILEKEQ